MFANNAESTTGHEVRIRRAVFSDAAEIARLLTELGHPTTSVEVESRWAEWEAEGNGAFVANAEGARLVGFCSMHKTRVLHRPKLVGRITSLVVDETVRGKGIGRELVYASEAEFTRADCGVIEVTSNARRIDAHRFYEQLGYEKTSVRLAKDTTAH